MTLAIRPATIADAAQIARVHVIAWQVAYEELVPREYLDRLDIGDRTHQWQSILSGKSTTVGVPQSSDLVADLDGQVVGFANVGRFREDPEDQTLGELWAMYVDPASWGTGVGDALMATTLEELNHLGTTTAFLWVLEGNGRARRFYERHGWRQDDQIKTFEIAGVEVPEVRYSQQST